MTTSKPSNAAFGFISGRSDRREYWLSVLGLLIFNVVLALVLPPLLVSTVSLPLWILIASRRLHDFGRTGWWSLIPLGVGFFIGFLGGAGMGIPGTVALVVNGSVTILTTVFIGSIAGSKGENRFGSAPNTDPQEVSAVFD